MRQIYLLLLSIVLIINTTYSQNNAEPLTGKKGQIILPEKGEIGIGVNLLPFFYWLGNSANANGNNTYAGNDKFFQIFGNSVVMGKYMLADKMAFRWAWGLNFGHVDEDKYVQNDASNAPNDMVKDSRSLDWSMASISGGVEMRRGKGRVQGFWGGDIFVTYNQDDDYRYYYGNAFSTTNTIPTGYNWGNNLNNNRRRTMDTGVNVIGLGIRAFAGIEYFIAPKMAIGAEFGWGISYRYTLTATIAEEYFESSSGNTILEERFIGDVHRFSAGVDNLNGAVYMMFFF